jgi:hypothetical protein
MPFLDTEPATLQRHDASASWGRFRVSEPRRVAATLRALWQHEVPLTLGDGRGPRTSAVLWSLDDGGGRLHFSLGAALAELEALDVEGGLWAAGYLDEVKLQFDVRATAFDRVGAQFMLHAEPPRWLFELPRRRAMRVRRSVDEAPRVSFAHPQQPGVVVELRAIDLGPHGCALWRPAAAPRLLPGDEFGPAQVTLGDGARFDTWLRVHHLTAAATGAGPHATGTRIGCSWQGLGASAARTLQTWLDHGRRRRGMMSLSLD